MVGKVRTGVASGEQGGVGTLRVMNVLILVAVWAADIRTFDGAPSP